MQLYKKVNPITQGFEEFARHHTDNKKCLKSVTLNSSKSVLLTKFH